MFFKALATDYDGTLAADGVVSGPTVAALEALCRSGRRLILVTGRELPDLRAVFGRIDLFDRIVAENGALLVRPDSGEEVPLAPPPPPSFVARLKERNVQPFSQGRVILATRVPHDAEVLATIRDLGLELQIVFNKGAVMVLPPGVNKATGLAAAAAELGLSPRNIVAVGDAENDHAFLRACGCGVAVANALDMLKDASDWVTEGTHGAGVAELVERLMADDLAGLDLRRRLPLSLGKAQSGTDLGLEWRGERLLVAGPAAERTAWIAPLLGQMRAGGLQVLILDRGGAYAGAAGLTAVGGSAVGPRIASVCELLEDASIPIAVNLRAFTTHEAASFIGELLPRLHSMCEKYGRPHWLVFDRANSMATPALAEFPGVIYGAGLPRQVPREVLAAADAVVLLADAARELPAVAEARGLTVPLAAGMPKSGEARLWRPASSAPPVTVALEPSPPPAPARRAVR